MMGDVVDWWQSRAQRERYAIFGAGLAMLVTAGFLALEPLLDERTRLRASIPGQQSDLAWMRAHLAEARHYASRAAGGGEVRFSAASVRAGLATAGLEGQATRIGEPRPGRVVVGFDAVAHAALIDWLAKLEGDGDSRLAHADIRALSARPGQVEASFEFDARAENRR